MNFKPLDEIVTIIKGSPRPLVLTFDTKMPSPPTKTLVHCKFEQEQLGIHLTNIEDESTGKDIVIIDDIVPGGPASKFKMLSINDIVAAINDESVIGRNLNEISAMIITGTRPLKISFQKPSIMTTNGSTKSDIAPVDTILHTDLFRPDINTRNAILSDNQELQRWRSSQKSTVVSNIMPTSQQDSFQVRDEEKIGKIDYLGESMMVEMRKYAVKEVTSALKRYKMSLLQERRFSRQKLIADTVDISTDEDVNRVRKRAKYIEYIPLIFFRRELQSFEDYNDDEKILSFENLIQFTDDTQNVKMFHVAWFWFLRFRW